MSILSKIVKVVTNLDHFISGDKLTLAFINKYIEEYGEMIDFKIDNKNKTISASVLLKGENSPIKVTVGEYELIKENEKSRIMIKEASSDRDWIDAALRNFVVGKKFDLPEKSVDFINDFLG